MTDQQRLSLRNWANQVIWVVAFIAVLEALWIHFSRESFSVAYFIIEVADSLGWPVTYFLVLSWQQYSGNKVQLGWRTWLCAFGIAIPLFSLVIDGIRNVCGIPSEFDGIGGFIFVNLCMVVFGTVIAMAATVVGTLVERFLARWIRKNA